MCCFCGFYVDDIGFLDLDGFRRWKQYVNRRHILFYMPAFGMIRRQFVMPSLAKVSDGPRRVESSERG